MQFLFCFLSYYLLKLCFYFLRQKMTWNVWRHQMSFEISFMPPIGTLSFLFSVSQWEASKMFQVISDGATRFSVTEPLSKKYLIKSTKYSWLMVKIIRLPIILSVWGNNYGFSLRMKKILMDSKNSKWLPYICQEEMMELTLSICK